jgi:hypothetical protein
MTSSSPYPIYHTSPPSQQSFQTPRQTTPSRSLSVASTPSLSAFNDSHGGLTAPSSTANPGYADVPVSNHSHNAWQPSSVPTSPRPRPQIEVTQFTTEPTAAMSRRSYHQSPVQSLPQRSPQASVDEDVIARQRRQHLLQQHQQ